MIVTECKYSQEQIHRRAEYYGKYMYYSCRQGLTGRELRVAIAKDMRVFN